MAQKIASKYQISISIFSILATSFLFFGIKAEIGYYVVALVLMLMVSTLAMLLDIIPVLLAAVLSALIWNFFFIPPIFTFHIDKTEDLLMFLMYFVIASVNAVLTAKLRKQEQKARDKEEKEKEIRLYNALLNSLSHELRTPIATIMGAVDTLKESHLSAEHQHSLLVEIDKANSRLDRQVENLLNMSRLETGMLRIKRDWCDLNDMITSVLQKLEMISQQHDIIFLANEHLPYFKLDIALMEEVCYNILHNAIQYTPQGTKIEICLAQAENTCIITIADNGGGFPEQEIGFVFDKFYRLPQTKAGGTGLGLSIVKGFVEAHNGSISLKNNAWGGATFTIHIPAETSYLNQLKHE